MGEMVVTGTGVRRMRELGLRLRGQDKALRVELVAAARRAAEPIVADVRSAVMDVPSRGMTTGGAFARAAHLNRKRPRGLRASIAQATGAQVATTGKNVGVKIRVKVSKLPPDQVTLPWALDSPTGWRHPVFGNDVWVKQVGRPWFASTIRKHQAAAQAQIGLAMDATAAKITKP
jgi:hypothetical protein